MDPVMITVTMPDGSQWSLSGEKLQRYMEYVRDCIARAQEAGKPIEDWSQSKWDREK
jgi:hypothetical protein